MRYLLPFALSLLAAAGGVAQRDRIDPERFGSWAAYSAPPLAGRLVVADFNGDGRKDIATVSRTTSGGWVALLMNTGGRSLGVPRMTSPAAAVHGIDAGDVDGDGDVDLVVGAQPYYGTTVLVLRNDGSGSFAPPVPVSVNQSPRAVGLGDIDGDGDLDLVVGSSSTPMTVLRNDGRGNFGSRTDLTAAPSVLDLSLADLDGDGRLDIVGVGAEVTYVLRGLGNGAFAVPSILPTPGTAAFDDNVRRIAIGDLDGDRRPDLVVDLGTSGTLRTFLNQGGGLFSTPVDTSTRQTRSAPRIGDLDGDGVNELVTTGVDTYVWNSGTLVQMDHYARGEYSEESWLGDLDGDGFLELLVMNYQSLEVRQLDNQGRLRTPSAFATNASAYGLQAADFDQDGLVDILRGEVPMVAHRNLGNGSFAPGLVIGPGVPRDATLADVNRDSFPDLIYRNTATSIAVRPGSSSLTFGTPIVSAIPSTMICEVTKVLIGDVNGDGLVDAVVGNSNARGCAFPRGHLWVRMLGDGNGAFASPVAYQTAAHSPDRVALADFDRDGDLDVALAHHDDLTLASRLVEIWRNDGAGSFSFLSNFPTDASQQEMVAADLDLDGDADLVVLNAGDDRGSEPAITVAVNDGQGRFSATTYPTRRDSNPLLQTERDLRLADLDGDRLPEIAFSTTTVGGTIVVFKNLGAGRFGPFAEVGAGLRLDHPWASGIVTGCALADFDNDGFVDIATGDDLTAAGNTPSSASVTVLWNRWTPETSPALVQDARTIAAGTGGTVNLQVELSRLHAGRSYLGLVSLSGETPGFDLGPAHMFLNVDAATTALLPFVNGPILPGFAGVIDAAGRAQASMVLPAGVATPLIGSRFTFAFAALTVPIAPTNPVFVRVVP